MEKCLIAPHDKYLGEELFSCRENRKKRDDMQIDRLLQIVFLLLRHEYITARQLAEELNVSTRTIYRDINILSLAGIPITSQKGYNGGLSLLQGFSLDKSYFTQAEQNNIIHALQILNPPIIRMLIKPEQGCGLFSHNMQSEWLEIDFSYWGSRKRSGSILRHWSVQSSISM